MKIVLTSMSVTLKLQNMYLGIKNRLKIYPSCIGSALKRVREGLFLEINSLVEVIFLPLPGTGFGCLM